jgi:hypothetical protein
MMAKLLQTAPNPPASRTLAVHWRVLISIGLAIHLAAIVSAPWSMGGLNPRIPPPAIPGIVVQAAGPYLDATYSGHGYRFFCPEPGPSHLVRYRIEMPDGTTSTGTFPDLKSEWPRLFYHRHFMLTEKLAGFWNPDELPRDAPPQARANWQSMRKTFEAVAQSYAVHLLASTGARAITLQLVEHQLPGPDELAANISLNDAKLDQVLWTSPTYRNDTP